MTFIRREFVANVLCVLFGASACSAEVVVEEALGLQTQPLSLGCAPAVPGELKVPEGHRLAFAMDAAGIQIYQCSSANDGSAAWTLLAPDAQLFNRRGRLVGVHYAGPTWEAIDGSTVVGTRMAAATPDPSAIAWLLLSAASTTGHGSMSKVTYIQRLETEGGLAPQAGCDADHLGAKAESTYSATYYFYKACATDTE